MRRDQGHRHRCRRRGVCWLGMLSPASVAWAESCRHKMRMTPSCDRLSFSCLFKRSMPTIAHVHCAPKQSHTTRLRHVALHTLPGISKVQHSLVYKNSLVLSTPFLLELCLSGLHCPNVPHISHWPHFHSAHHVRARPPILVTMFMIAPRVSQQCQTNAWSLGFLKSVGGLRW